MRRFVFVLVLLAGTAASCLPTDPMGPVQIRVENASDQLMNAVLVGFPDDEIVYGDVPPGAATAYREVERAYRYAYVRTVVDGDTLGIVPIDYVGETLLEPGLYTYRLDLFEGRSLTLELVRD